MEFLLQLVHRHIALFYCHGFLLRYWQRLLIHFLVLVEWDSIDLHGHGRHHVGRFFLKNEVVQCLNIHLFVTYHVCSDEFATALVIKGLHRGILNARELSDDGFHLFQLNAETANLHLSVATANELDVAIGEVANDVARAIDGCPFRFVRKRIRNKHFHLFLRTVQIAMRHLRTAEPQLAQRTCGKPLAIRVCDIRTHILQRFADGNIGVFLVYFEGRHNDSGLRRTIAVMQLVSLRGRERCQFLACHREVQQRVVLNVCRKLIANLRGDEGMGDMLAFEIFVERHKVEAQLLGDDMHGGTSRQRRIDAFLMHIKAITGIFSNVMLRL